MPYPKFLFYNFMGATVWGVIVVTLAYFVGMIIPLNQLISLMTKFGFLALLIFAGWIFIPTWLKSHQKKPSYSQSILGSLIFLPTI
ncbi:hypothetical protein [Geminocystis sp. GBBB08]|uniref:hypothetical protein n=1 Tax=Geminocystis sp. GBBB08 TaxID=2604140 RepID=UPI0027E296D9|nr:hypothetical protein [Geminocystis sp. GBBB08]MBL1210337.1 hypothetical protein [Geminocystis sp. GBBB08]